MLDRITGGVSMVIHSSATVQPNQRHELPLKRSQNILPTPSLKDPRKKFKTNDSSTVEAICTEEFSVSDQNKTAIRGTNAINFKVER